MKKFLQLMERAFAAVSFAEAGEHEKAREILEEQGPPGATGEKKGFSMYAPGNFMPEEE